MKKLVAMVMAVLLLASMLVGCGAGGNDKNENGQTIVRVGNWPTKEGIDMDNILELKSRFEASNPDAVIEPDTWVFDRKTFYAKAAGGQLPTVYLAGFTEMPEIIASGYSADITDALKKYGLYDQINPVVLRTLTNDEGKVVAYPHSVSVMGLMVNVDLMEQAGLLEADGTPKQPKTWFEVVEFAKQIKEKTGKPGFVMPTANNSGGWLFTALAWSFGVDFMEKDADGKWQATFNTPEAAEALQFVKDMKWVHDILPANTLIDGTEWKKVFGTGGAGITFGAGDYPSRNLNSYGMDPNSVGMIAIPAGPKAHVSLLAGEVKGINSAATKDQIDATVRWLKMNQNPELTEDVKVNVAQKIATSKEKGQIVGLLGMDIWGNDAPSKKYADEEYTKNTNINLNHVRLYNEFAANPTCEVKPEEPVCCQELYKTLDACLQEVLTNKDADVVAVLEKANSDFQNNYLNNM